jgi:two-component system, NarL family, sensor kinase
MEKKELLIGVILTSAIVLLIGGFLLFALIWYRRRTNQYIVERENMRAEFEKQLMQTQLEIQEQTLNNISQEIHDSVGQDLSLTKIQLNIVEVSEGLGKEVLQGARDSLSKAILDLRDMAKTLNTERIRHFNLVSSIEEEMNRIRRTRFLFSSFITEGVEKPFDGEKKLILFRIIQECLQNIIKHANATEILLKFYFREDGLEIFIRDNGKGFDVDNAMQSQTGLGLQSITSRAKMVGGKAEFVSRIQDGTTVNIFIPYE